MENLILNVLLRIFAIIGFYNCLIWLVKSLPVKIK